MERRLLLLASLRMFAATFVVALTAMLAVAAAQAPSEPPAALRRPNLQVLTTVPESHSFH